MTLCSAVVARDRLLDPVFIAAGTSDQWHVRSTQSFWGILLICWSESQQFGGPPAVCVGPSAAQWKLKSAPPAGVSLSISVNYISAMPGGGRRGDRRPRRQGNAAVRCRPLTCTISTCCMPVYVGSTCHSYKNGTHTFVDESRTTIVRSGVM